MAQARLVPFTPSHVLAILPLIRGRAGLSLDTTALAIGAMVPDLPYFVPPHAGSQWTHAWYGPATLDLLLGDRRGVPPAGRLGRRGRDPGADHRRDLGRRDRGVGSLAR